MIRPALPSEVLSRFHTDKNSGVPQGHSYGQFYDAFLPRYKWCQAVCELGVDQGESLRAWEDYFRDAEVVGVDKERSRLFNSGRIKTLLMDCGDEGQLRRFANEYAGYFNVLIDDASHRIDHQLLTARVLKRAIRPYGLIIIEDVSSEANARLLEAEGFRTEQWDTNQRSDNRICWYHKENEL